MFSKNFLFFDLFYIYLTQENGPLIAKNVENHVGMLMH